MQRKKKKKIQIRSKPTANAEHCKSTQQGDPPTASLLCGMQALISLVRPYCRTDSEAEQIVKKLAVRAVTGTLLDRTPREPTAPQQQQQQQPSSRGGSDPDLSSQRNKRKRVSNADDGDDNGDGLSLLDRVKRTKLTDSSDEPADLAHERQAILDAHLNTSVDGVEIPPEIARDVMLSVMERVQQDSMLTDPVVVEALHLSRPLCCAGVDSRVQHSSDLHHVQESLALASALFDFPLGTSVMAYALGQNPVPLLKLDRQLPNPLELTPVTFEGFCIMVADTMATVRQTAQRDRVPAAKMRVEMERLNVTYPAYTQVAVWLAFVDFRVVPHPRLQPLQENARKLLEAIDTSVGDYTPEVDRLFRAHMKCLGAVQAALFDAWNDYHITTDVLGAGIIDALYFTNRGDACSLPLQEPWRQAAATATSGFRLDLPHDHLFVVNHARDVWYPQTPVPLDSVDVRRDERRYTFYVAYGMFVFSCTRQDALDQVLLAADVADRHKLFDDCRVLFLGAPSSVDEFAMDVDTDKDARTVLLKELLKERTRVDMVKDKYRNEYRGPVNFSAMRDNARWVFPDNELRREGKRYDFDATTCNDLYMCITGQSLASAAAATLFDRAILHPWFAPSLQLGSVNAASSWTTGMFCWLEAGQFAMQYVTAVNASILVLMVAIMRAMHSVDVYADTQFQICLDVAARLQTAFLHRPLAREKKFPESWWFGSYGPTVVTTPTSVATFLHSLSNGKERVGDPETLRFWVFDLFTDRQNANRIDSVADPQLAPVVRVIADALTHGMAYGSTESLGLYPSTSRRITPAEYGYEACGDVFLCALQTYTNDAYWCPAVASYTGALHRFNALVRSLPELQIVWKQLFDTSGYLRPYECMLGLIQHRVVPLGAMCKQMPVQVDPATLPPQERPAWLQTQRAGLYTSAVFESSGARASVTYPTAHTPGAPEDALLNIDVLDFKGVVVYVDSNGPVSASSTGGQLSRAVATLLRFEHLVTRATTFIAGSDALRNLNVGVYTDNTLLSLFMSLVVQINGDSWRYSDLISRDPMLNIDMLTWFPEDLLTAFAFRCMGADYLGDQLGLFPVIQPQTVDSTVNIAVADKLKALLAAQKVTSAASALRKFLATAWDKIVDLRYLAANQWARVVTAQLPIRFSYRTALAEGDDVARQIASVVAQFVMEPTSGLVLNRHPGTGSKQRLVVSLVYDIYLASVPESSSEMERPTAAVAVAVGGGTASQILIEWRRDAPGRLMVSLMLQAPDQTESIFKLLKHVSEKLTSFSYIMLMLGCADQDWAVVELSKLAQMCAITGLYLPATEKAPRTQDESYVIQALEYTRSNESRRPLLPPAIAVGKIARLTDLDMAARKERAYAEAQLAGLAIINNVVVSDKRITMSHVSSWTIQYINTLSPVEASRQLGWHRLFNRALAPAVSDRVVPKMSAFKRTMKSLPVSFLSINKDAGEIKLAPGVRLNETGPDQQEMVAVARHSSELFNAGGYYSSLDMQTYAGTFYYWEPASDVYLLSGSHRVPKFATKTEAALWLCNASVEELDMFYRERMPETPYTERVVLIEKERSGFIDDMLGIVDTIVDDYLEEVNIHKTEERAQRHVWVNQGSKTAVKMFLSNQEVFFSIPPLQPELAASLQADNNPETIKPWVVVKSSLKDMASGNMPDVLRNAIFPNSECIFYASEDTLDQILATSFSDLGINVVMFTHMAGKTRFVSEVLDTRARSVSFDSLVGLIDT